jgi:hypothetical protein
LPRHGWGFGDGERGVATAPPFALYLTLGGLGFTSRCGGGCEWDADAGLAGRGGNAAAAFVGATAFVLFF